MEHEKMVALRPFYDSQVKQVTTGQEFSINTVHAAELEKSGLAVKVANFKKTAREEKSNPPRETKVNPAPRNKAK